MIVTPQRAPRKRAYLMCPPEYFAVRYTINPWMDTGAPVDAELALKQWTGLRETLVRLGHTVHTVPPRPDLPDMVYAANSAFTADGVAYGARFRYPQRMPEAAAYQAWFEAAGWRYVVPVETNEGEGDFAFLREAYGGVVLAGHGYRTEPAAHAEAQEALGRPVIPLRLVDPRFYHLDTALTVLDGATIAYFPGAFSAPSQRVLRQLFPDLGRGAKAGGAGAVIADETDAEAFGLNAISDGRHVVLNAEAGGMASKLAAAGYAPVPVELGELKKGGGSAKCCVAELRP